MVEKPEHGTNWESFIKMLLSRLDIPTKEDINFLHRRLDKLEQLLYQELPAKKNKKIKPVARKKSASSIVLDVIANHPEGTNFKTIKAATGFNDKKLRNIIFRLDKIKRIKRVKRGIYKKA
ncbi:MAG: phasin family protein [Deltaproteobacteria bacterium]|nr:phasin family protein [Deltaproteobacteria bacterium]